MSAVMQQDGQRYRFQLLLADVVTLAPEQLDGTPHQMHGAQTVRKSGVVGAGIDHVGHADLLDPPQALEIWMLNDVKMQFVRDVDKSVDGVVDDFLLVGFHLNKIDS